MADPLGNQGITPRPPSTDMDSRRGRRPGFMERLQSLAEVKNAADRAVREMRWVRRRNLRLAKAEQLKADAADALAKAEEMKEAAEDALVKAGQDVFDATRKVEDARVQAKAIIADAAAQSAAAEQRMAAVERAEQDVMKERARCSCGREGGSGHQERLRDQVGQPSGQVRSDSSRRMTA